MKLTNIIILTFLSFLFTTPSILAEEIQSDVKGQPEISENGGLIVELPHEISKNTWICLFTDPSGVTFAMLQKTKSTK